MKTTPHIDPLAFANLHRARATRNAVRKSLRAYLRYLSGNTSASDEQLAAFAGTYLRKSVDLIYTDICRYAVHLRDTKKNAPNTIRLKMYYAFAYLACNRISITPADKKRLQNLLPRPVTVTEEEELTRQTLKTLVTAADPQMKTILLLLISSGMRISELLSITRDQIRYGTPTEICINREHMKAGKPHIYCISKEAETALAAYLAGIQHHSEHEPGLRRIFPSCYATIGKHFLDLQKKTGVHQWSPQGRRSTITLHSIRKWTESEMKLHIPINLANELIGHDEGLSAHYRRYGREQMRTAYQTVEPHLTLFTRTKKHRSHTQHSESETLLAEQKRILSRLEQIEILLKTPADNQPVKNHFVLLREDSCHAFGTTICVAGALTATSVGTSQLLPFTTKDVREKSVDVPLSQVVVVPLPAVAYSEIEETISILMEKMCRKRQSTGTGSVTASLPRKDACHEKTDDRTSGAVRSGREKT